MMQNSHSREDSPVIHETLNVIDEHITDMSSTPRTTVAQRSAANDSGSEYSSHVNPRASYVHGDESDEDERLAFSEEEVSKWNALEVARYLESIGVDRKHCEVFKEQEISGDILLGMDQSTIFMKEFDLGVVGRRLRTWHKIRSFQEEVRSIKDVNSRAGDFFDEPDFAAGSQGSGAKFPRIPSLVNRPGAPGSPKHRQPGSPFPRPASQMPISANGSPVSVRGAELTGEPNRASRRHSSIDFKSAHPSMMPSALDTTPPQTGAPHRKQPSLDRGWSLAAATAAAGSPDALTPDAADLGSRTPKSERELSMGTTKEDELDRGYMSGGDLDVKRNRNVLRKSPAHSRQSSFKEEGGNLAPNTPNKRHSRFGSAGSIRDTITSLATGGRLRSMSARDQPTTSTVKDRGPPLVTKLDYPQKSVESSVSKQNFLNAKSKFEALSREREHVPPSDEIQLKPPLRTLASFSMTNLFKYKTDRRAPDEQTIAASTTTKSSEEKTPINSPSITSPGDTATGNSSPRTSAAPSTKAPSLDSTDSIRKSLTGRSSTGSKPPRPKHKSKTSAYTRGLRKTAPKDALNDCDYSGWMKKKSPGLMAIWRPRLFVLHGRRLAYYYGEDDVEEKGLIDISNHRVLPAENEFLAGMHAAATRATTTPTSPANASLETKNGIEAAAVVDKDPPAKSPKIGSGESMFIFKLVPPRTGLSKAVQFTKPTVHYFATDNVKQGRLWMAALMKATIDRDPDAPITSTYQQKTISLAKAKAMRQRPPALMGVDEEAGKQDPAKPMEAPETTITDATPKVDGLDTDPVTSEAITDPNTSTDQASAAGGLGIEGVSLSPNALAPTDGTNDNRTQSPGRPSLRLVRSMSGGLSNTSKTVQRTLSGSSKISTKPATETEEVAQ